MKGKGITHTDLFNKLLVEGKYKECGFAINKFVQKANPKEYSLKGIRKITDFLNIVFLISPKEPEEMESLYS